MATKPFVWSRVDRGEIEFRNAVLGTFRPIDFAFGSQPHRIEISAPGAFSPETTLSIRIGPNESALRLSGLTSVAPLRELLGGTDWSLLPVELQAAAVESAFRPVVDVLERSLATSVTFGAAVEAAEESKAVRLEVRLGGPSGTAVRGQVLLNSAAAGMIRAAVERISPQAWVSADLIPVPARVMLGSTELPVRELRGLQPFDVVLVEERLGAVGEGCLLVLTPRHRYPGILKNQTLTIASLMSQPEQKPAAAAAPPAGVPVDELPVQLTFDVGQVELTVGELRTLKPGYTFELAHGVERPVSVRANGRPVAVGELVQIGDRVGVRLLEITGTGSAP